MNSFLQNAREKRDEMIRDLYVRYPRAFGPDRVRMCVAFGPGWFRLVDEFFASVNDRLSDDLAARFCIDQIKEKLGGMRIYYSVLPLSDDGEPQSQAAGNFLDFPFKEIDALKSNVQMRSWSTCFFCGAPGVKRKTLWMHVSCDACETKLEPGA